MRAYFKANRQPCTPEVCVRVSSRSLLRDIRLFCGALSLCTPEMTELCVRALKLLHFNADGISARSCFQDVAALALNRCPDGGAFGWLCSCKWAAAGRQGCWFFLPAFVYGDR